MMSAIHRTDSERQVEYSLYRHIVGTTWNVSCLSDLQMSITPSDTHSTKVCCQHVCALEINLGVEAPSDRIILSTTSVVLTRGDSTLQQGRPTLGARFAKTNAQQYVGQ